MDQLTLMLKESSFPEAERRQAVKRKSTVSTTRPKPFKRLRSLKLHQKLFPRDQEGGDQERCTTSNNEAEDNVAKDRNEHTVSPTL